MKNNKIYNLCKKLWPINRSLTGEGNLETLKILKQIHNKLKIKNINSGKKVFDWKIPNEWNAYEAWIKNSQGKKILDFKKNNLHLVSYSKKIHKKISLEQLKKNLHFIKDQPEAIPYVTSYYKKNWGFCMSFNEIKKLKKGNYEVFINSSIKKTKLIYGEILIKGKYKKEIFLSTYICHPSMANNELSGPAVTINLAKWISQKKRKYSYRIIFIPETIGSIGYINKNFKTLKKNVIGGFNITCVGDDRNYSFLPSRNGQTLSDKVGLQTIKKYSKNFKKYTWLNRGGDERQYCSPGVDLPIATLMRSKYGTYKEYHTSLDNLKKVVTPKGLQGGYSMIKNAINTIEKNKYYVTTFLCEPHMSKRNLYPSIGKKKHVSKFTKTMMNVITYCDGKHSINDISYMLKIKEKHVSQILKKLLKFKLIEELKCYNNN
jgi:aminopeptidase-like protein